MSATFVALADIPVGAIVRHDRHVGELMSNQDQHAGGYRRFEMNCRCGCGWYIGSTVGSNELEVLELPAEDDGLVAVRAINDFLRHLNAGDLEDRELFSLKARAFDLMAASHDADGPAFADRAAVCRAHAAEARARASGLPSEAA